RTIIMFGHKFDPNLLSVVILLGVVSAFNEVFSLFSVKKRCFYVVLILLYYIGIFFTGSRGGLISTVITSALFLFLETKKRENRKLVRIIIVIVALAFIIMIPLLPTSLVEDRFSTSSILGLNELNAGVHNRYSIWESALKLIPDRLLFGYGTGNFLTAIKKVYYRSCASHNLYLLLLVETGIIGFLIFITFLLYLLNKLRKNKQYSSYAMLIGILTISLTLDTLPYKYFWVGLIYAELTINSKKNISGLLRIKR
ncbi:MAG: O-antigen ligase family protein, partial [Clostridia bacterium]|nr:O-antigen ligase family protein [Clostridia bacterium]